MRDDEDSYAFRFWLLSGLSGETDDVELPEDEEELTIVDTLDFVTFQDPQHVPKVVEK